MAKVRKLNWNVQQERLISVWGVSKAVRVTSAASDDIGFLNAVGNLDQTKFFMMMVSSKDPYGIQNLCLLCRIIHKNYLCLHDTQWKRALVYTISRPIFETQIASSKMISLGLRD